MGIEISVIVTGYNRKEFLSSALNSLMRQSLNKELFEVLLFTNYEYNLDDFMSLEIHHYILEGSVGEYMYQAIQTARGDIICFLDDDDVFLPDKLMRLKENFNNNAVYYKNNTKIFYNDKINMESGPIKNMKLHTIKTKAIRKPNKYAYNRSSISIKKKHIIRYLNALRLLDVSEDWFFFLTVFYEGKKGIYDPEILSLYRKHNSVSRQAIHSSDHNYNFYLGYLDRLLNSFSYMERIFPNPIIENTIEYQLAIFRIRKNLLSNNFFAPEMKKDIKTLLYAILRNYSDVIIVATLFIRAFVATYWFRLYPYMNKYYIKISNRLNKQIVEQ